MSYPDITELSNAFTLCTCGSVCSRACTVCMAVTWEKGPCVKQLWAWHADTTDRTKCPHGYGVRQGPCPVCDVPVLTDAEIVECAIDFTKKLGMHMEPWQAAALRAILLHGGDVAIGVRY